MFSRRLAIYQHALSALRYEHGPSGCISSTRGSLRSAASAAQQLQEECENGDMEHDSFETDHIGNADEAQGHRYPLPHLLSFLDPIRTPSRPPPTLRRLARIPRLTPSSPYATLLALPASPRPSPLLPDLVPAFLSSLSPPAGDVPLLQRQRKQLELVILHVSPDRKWNHVKVRIHRALISLWARYLSVLKQLHSLDALRDPASKHGSRPQLGASRFLPLLLSLVRTAPSLRSLGNRPSLSHCPDRLTVESVLEIMADLQIPPSAAQLRLVLQHYALPDLIDRRNLHRNMTPPETRARRDRAQTALGIKETAEDWQRRQGLHEIATRLLGHFDPAGPVSVFEDDRFWQDNTYQDLLGLSTTADEVVLSSLEEAGLFPSIPAPLLAEMDYWKTKRDESLDQWLAMIRAPTGVLSQWESDAAAAPTVGEGRLLWLMVRERLLPGPLRSALALALPSPLELLRYSLGKPDSPPRAHPQEIRIVSIIVRLWAHYSHHQDFEFCVSVLQVLVSDVRAPPRLPKRLLTRMLCSPKTPEQMGALLPLLNRLEAPTLALELKGDVLRRLRMLAASAGEVDLLESLYEKWGLDEIDRRGRSGTG